MENLYPYIHSLLGTKYVWWKENDEFTRLEPFWLENTVAPDAEVVKNRGCNCAGFINLIMRKLNKPILGLSEGIRWAGGTYIWFTYLEERGQLESFTLRAVDAGDILLRNYESPEEQGHIALAIGNGLLAHSVPEKGVVIEDIHISHNWLECGYYTHIWKGGALRCRGQS